MSGVLHPARPIARIPSPASDAREAGRDGSVRLSVYHAGSQRCSPGHAWAGVRDHYLIHIVEAGSGVYACRGVQRFIGAAHAFVVRPGELVRYHADRIDPWTYHWFGFGGAAADEVAHAIGLDSSTNVVPIEPAHEMERLLAVHRELCRDVQQGPRRLWSATGRLYEALQVLHDALVPAPGGLRPARSATLYVQAVYDFVRRNYSRRTSIEEIASYVGVSRKYLSQVVRSETGSTPRDILQEHRQQVARTLLLTTDLPVGAVAQSCGYSDRLLFSRQFRRFFGCSPSGFRARAGVADDGCV